MVFYDKSGTPRCYSDDFMHIYSYDGKPLGYIQEGKVWNYGGMYLGVFRNDWIIDRDGCYLYFTENSTGGPLKPCRKSAPLKSFKQLRPLKSIKVIPSVPPMPLLEWSNRELEAFFDGK